MSSRVVGAGLALIAALLLAVQLATPAVLPAQLALFAGHPTVEGHTRHAQDVYVGLYTAQLCRTDSDVPCKTGQPRTPFRVTAYGELAATGVLAIGAVVLALLTLRRSERRKDAARVVRIAGAVAILLLVALVLVAPFAEASTPIGLSADPLLIGMPLYVVGVLGAMLASVIAVRPPPPIKLRVAAPPADAGDPARDPRARRDSRGPVPEPMDPLDPYGASGPLRPLYEATPMQGGTGGLLPMTPSRASAIPTPFGSEPFGAEPSRPLPFGAPDVGRRAQSIGADASQAQLPPPAPRSKSASVPPRTQLGYVPPLPDAEGDLFAGAEDPLASAPSQLGPPAGGFVGGARVEGGRAAPPTLAFPGPPAFPGASFGEPSASAAPAAPAAPYPAAPGAAFGEAPASAAPAAPYPAAPSAAFVPRGRPETPLAPPPPPVAPWPDDASTFAPPFDPSLDPSTGSFDISMEPSEIATPLVPLIPASVPSQAPPHARTMLQPAAQPTMVHASARPPTPESIAAQSSTVTAPPPIPQAAPPPPVRTGPSAPPPARAGATAPPPIPQAAQAVPRAPIAASSPPFAAPVPPAAAHELSPPAHAPPSHASPAHAAPPSHASPPSHAAPPSHASPAHSAPPSHAPPAHAGSPSNAPPPAHAAPPSNASPSHAAPPSHASPPVAPSPTTAPAPGPSSPPSTLVAAVPPAGPPAIVAPLTRSPRDTQAPRADQSSPRPLRAAVPMPARPTPSTRSPVAPTRPPPPRPTLASQAVPPPAIPPIPAIPIPAIPALPKRPETDAEELAGETAARVPIEISDNNSQTNVSFGIPSAEELEAAVAEARAARGEASPAPDTSPTGEPVAPSPPALRPMPKLPISTAPDTLPPPKDSKQANGPSPACPQCESPMNWVEEHLRFYCKSCRMYF